MKYTRIELPNGIRCIHQRVKSAIVYCGLTVGAGSRDEHTDEYGIAHLTEHSMFKGTIRRKAFQINNRLESLGGELNAFTTKEETVIHSTALRRDFSKAAELISDVAFNSVYPQNEVDKEKDIIFDEINSYKDTPSERIFDEYEDLIFAGSSLGHNILGDKRSLKKYTSDSIRRFTARTYNTDRMVFSCVGDISEKRFQENCERYFSDTAINKRNFERTKSVDVEPFELISNKGTFQSHCIIGSRAYSISDKRRIELALLVNMLGGASANSILNTQIREKNALAYNVEAGYTPMSDTGLATIYFGTDRDNLDRCRELVMDELHKICNGSITKRVLSLAKRQFTGQLYISAESNEANMLGSGRSILIYNDIDSLESVVSRINSVTDTDITDVANEIFGKDLSVLIYK